MNRNRFLLVTESRLVIIFKNNLRNFISVTAYFCQFLYLFLTLFIIEPGNLYSFSLGSVLTWLISWLLVFMAFRLLTLFFSNVVKFIPLIWLLIRDFPKFIPLIRWSTWSSFWLLFSILINDFAFRLIKLKEIVRIRALLMITVFGNIGKIIKVKSIIRFTLFDNISGFAVFFFTLIKEISLWWFLIVVSFVCCLKRIISLCRLWMYFLLGLKKIKTTFLWIFILYLRFRLIKEIIRFRHIMGHLFRISDISKLAKVKSWFIMLFINWLSLHLLFYTWSLTFTIVYIPKVIEIETLETFLLLPLFLWSFCLWFILYTISYIIILFFEGFEWVLHYAWVFSCHFSCILHVYEWTSLT